MRTTLDLDEDVLLAAKELAQLQKKTAGKVVSELVRKALIPENPPKFRNGFQLIHREPGEPIITMELVNRLRDEE
ncbi:MAG: CopG family transcriptional regulator [Bryobacteraceae bacterium]